MSESAADHWFLERYEAALWADHDSGHPGRPAPVETCWHCCPTPASTVDGEDEPT